MPPENKYYLEKKYWNPEKVSIPQSQIFVTVIQMEHLKFPCAFLVGAMPSLLQVTRSSWNVKANMCHIACIHMHHIPIFLTFDKAVLPFCYRLWRLDFVRDHKFRWFVVIG